MKKTFRKLLTSLAALSLAAVTALTVVGCGGSTVKVNPDKSEYVVGICQLVQHNALDAATKGFRDALTEELAKENRTVKFDEQNAQGDSNTCSTIVNSFVSKDVDLIMANATAALQAAYNATETIPVLGTSITEYGVALGIDNFTGVVGNNVSGTSDLAPLTSQAQMMLDLLPSANNFGILYCSAEPNSLYQANEVQKYLESNGKTVTKYTFSDSNDIAAVVTQAAQNSDCIYVPTDNTAASNTGIIDQVCSEKNVPVFAGEEGICKGCGFATLSISYYSLGVATGKMAAKVLLGKEDITKMKIGYDETPVKKYSAERCAKLGITVPTDAGYEELVTD